MYSGFSIFKDQSHRYLCMQLVGQHDNAIWYYNDEWVQLDVVWKRICGWVGLNVDGWWRWVARVANHKLIACKAKQVQTRANRCKLRTCETEWAWMSTSTLQSSAIWSQHPSRPPPCCRPQLDSLMRASRPFWTMPSELAGIWELGPKSSLVGWRMDAHKVEQVPHLVGFIKVSLSSSLFISSILHSSL